jgi:glycopeptide antibiotics resistance protein
MISVGLRLLLLWVLFISLATFSPFDFDTRSVAHSFSLFQDESHLRDPIHFALNLALFVPLGGLLHHQGRRIAKAQSIGILTAVVCLLISLAIEYFQRYLPSRDSSVIDVIANTSGAMIGAFGDRTWAASFQTRIDRIRTGTPPAMLSAALLVFTAATLLMSGALQARTRLSNWSAEYPLLLGNERTGDRPWRGRVFALTITDAATPLATVRQFSAGSTVVLPGSPIAAFDFSGNPPYEDKAGNVPAVMWAEASPALPGRSWLQSERAAARFAQRLRAANRFTLRIRCATDDTNQDGPARIVSNSFSTLLRNFTLGQQGADLIFRLRTPLTGENGSFLETIVPGVFANNHERDILVTYDGANVLGGIAGTDRIFRTQFGPSVPMAVLLSSVLPDEVRLAELPVYNMAYLGFLFLPPGMLMVLLGSTWRRQLLFSVVYLSIASLLLEATLAVVSGRLFSLTNVLTVSAVGAAVFVAAFAILSQPDVRSRREHRWSIATESSV